MYVSLEWKIILACVLCINVLHFDLLHFVLIGLDYNLEDAKLYLKHSLRLRSSIEAWTLYQRYAPQEVLLKVCVGLQDLTCMNLT